MLNSKNDFISWRFNTKSDEDMYVVKNILKECEEKGIEIHDEYSDLTSSMWLIYDRKDKNEIDDMAYGYDEEWKCIQAVES